MKPRIRLIIILLLPFCLLLSAPNPARAQIDSAAIKQRIFVYADSLVRSYYEKDWNTFIALTHPGIARLYGGMNSYVSIIQGVRQRFEDSMQEKKENVSVRQFIYDGKTWQCIIQRVRQTHLGGRDATVTSYMVGQSMDYDAATWKFFDIAENLMVNISAIMPDFSDELVVPEKKIAYDDEKPAANTATAIAPAKPKKKTSGRK